MNPHSQTLSRQPTLQHNHALYDPKGRLIEAQDVGGTAWRYAYGDDGRLSAALDPMQRLNFGVVYDGGGRVRRLQLPSGAIQYNYDPGSRSTTVVDRRTLSSRYFQNEEGITTRVVNTLGEETAIELDAARNPISLSRDGALIESMEYDRQHRLQLRHSVTSSGTIDTHYTYDPGSGLLTRTDSSSGTSRVFTYDVNGNVTSAVLDDGLHKYGYSSSGDLAAYSAAGSNLTFTSSPDGLIASMNEGAGVMSTFAYNGSGELSQAGFADGKSARHEYQSSGLRARLVYQDGRRVEYGYDPAGNLTSTKVFDAKGNQINGQKLALNDAYQVIDRTLFDGTKEIFQYDPSGNLTVHAVGRAITRFEYDELNRLVAVVTPTGERLTYTYEPGERSIVEEYEHSSLQVADLRDTGFTFASPAQVMSTRPVTAGWGTLRFSENLGTFQLANAAGTEIITPEVPVEQPLHKLTLVADSIPLQERQSAFNRPFNTMFMPAEYATINCCPECYFSSGHWICPPCDPPPIPNIDSIDPPVGLIGTTVRVTISGNSFGSAPTLTIGGTGITVSIVSRSDAEITADFAMNTSASTAGSHTVTVHAPGGSPATSFFVQVPSKIVRFDSPPGAPGGIGPLQTPTDGSVISLSGTILLTHQCGVYRNFVYDVVDQSGTPIEGTYTLTETFSNFSGAGSKSPDKPLSVVPGFLIADTQSLTYNAPLCLGPTDNQTFNQKFFATIAGIRFDLTTIINIQRGNFSGTLKVDTSITTP